MFLMIECMCGVLFYELIEFVIGVLFGMLVFEIDWMFVKYN